MKIGTFAKKFDITPATVRYYIDLGLITPRKHEGGQYSFDEQCVKDMSFIKELKTFGLQLTEINQILSMERMTKFKDIDVNDMFVELLEKKEAEIHEQIESLNQSMQGIRSQIDRIHDLPVEYNRSGIDLSFFSMFICPDCGKNLSINNANIQGQQLMSGTLSCECGYSARIEDGILILDGGENKAVPEGSWSTFLQDINLEFIRSQRGVYYWMTENCDFQNMKNKVFITTDRFSSGFLMENMNLLSRDNKYIIIYSSKEMLKHIRSRMDALEMGGNILYILDDGLHLPLRPQCIDVFLDDFSTSNYLFFHNTYPIEKLDRYMKKDSIIAGALFYYRKSSVTAKNISSEYPLAGIDRLSSPMNYMRKIESQGYKVLEQKNYEGLQNPGSGAEFSFHENGEFMYLWNYIAQKAD